MKDEEEMKTDATMRKEFAIVGCAPVRRKSSGVVKQSNLKSV